MSEEEIIKEEAPKKIKLESLPIHVLRTKVKEAGITSKPTDKKADLIKMLKNGETIHKPKKVKKAPTLEPKNHTILPIVPDEIKPQLEALAARGLTWEINEEDCTINFKRDLTSCANLDQSPRNILSTARAAFRASPPIEMGRENGAPIEWR